MIEVQHLSKSYSQGNTSISVLKNINFSLKPADTLAVIGPSGSGKTTLLSLLAGLDTPDQGNILLQGKHLTKMTEKERIDFRSQFIGIVFQQFHLIPHLTALENVSLPLEIHQTSPKIALEKAKIQLQQVGLSHRLHHFPRQLSGGEQQRTAIARACIHRPKLILADEPSGNLDQHSAQNVMNLLFSLVEKNQSTLILVTHNLKLARHCQKQFLLENQSFKNPPPLE